MKFVVIIIFVILKVSRTEPPCHCAHHCPHFPHTPCRSCQSGWFGQYCQKQNIARGKNASQSTTLNSQQWCGPSPADLAVDGNTDQVGENSSCSCTDNRKSAGAWWALWTYQGLQVFVDDSLCYTNDDLLSSRLDIMCDQVLSGNVVKVIMPSNVLRLCEVQVFVCSDGWFGTDCDKQCQCSNTSEVCDKVTGYCRSGCTAGKRGDGCQLNCTDGYYGDKCSSKCGQCKQSRPCSKRDGVCANGCQAFLERPYCQTCVPGRYLQNCSSRCSQCKGVQDCDRTTGHCPHECMPRYFGPSCVQECADYTFGNNCTGVCNCLNRCEVCDKVTGTCHTGCETTQYHTTVGESSTDKQVSAECTAKETDSRLIVLASLLAASCIVLAVLGIFHVKLIRQFSKYKAEKEEHYTSLEDRTPQSVYEVIPASQPYADVSN